MYELTCKNHPGARYLTKNPWLRTLHFISPDPSQSGECPCPFGDLVVIEGEGTIPVNEFFADVNF